MPSPVFSAQEVGEIISYVAPGFFARQAYEWRLPQRNESALRLLVLSIAASLPLVAAASWLVNRFDLPPDPRSLRYLIVLLGLSVGVGYGLALLRCAPWVRDQLLSAGHPHEPELSILTTALFNLPDGTYVTVAFKDGRSLSGQPHHGTNDPTLPTQYLFLVEPMWRDPGTDEWPKAPESGGVLVNLTEVVSVAADAVRGQQSSAATVAEDGQLDPSDSA